MSGMYALLNNKSQATIQSMYGRSQLYYQVPEQCSHVYEIITLASLVGLEIGDTHTHMSTSTGGLLSRSKTNT
jgi:hypothetical protein